MLTGRVKWPGLKTPHLISPLACNSGRLGRGRRVLETTFHGQLQQITSVSTLTPVKHPYCLLFLTFPPWKLKCKRQCLELFSHPGEASNNLKPFRCYAAYTIKILLGFRLNQNNLHALEEELSWWCYIPFWKLHLDTFQRPLHGHRKS